MAEYIVLRHPKKSTSARRGGLISKKMIENRNSDERPQLTYEDLDPAQAAELRRAPDVIEAARNMQTRLVRPTRRGARSVDKASWGIEAVRAHASAWSGSGVKVAVLDTGIDPTHPAFRGVKLTARNFTADGGDDMEGHGTHCAGTIFGRDVDGRRIGVALGVTDALIGKILDDKGEGSSRAIFEGILWAAGEGAQVISMSVGLDFPGQVKSLVAEGWPIEIATSFALDLYRRNLKIFEAAFASAGTEMFATKPLIVAAAGNESRRDINPAFLISASLPSTLCHLAVAAVQVEPTTGRYKVADFSNSDPTIAAPGVNILSAAAGGRLVECDGTSMACPHVAGVAALWAEKVRSGGGRVDADILKSHIISTARSDVIQDYDNGGQANVGRGMLTAP